MELGIELNSAILYIFKCGKFALDYKCWSKMIRIVI